MGIYLNPENDGFWDAIQRPHRARDNPCHGIKAYLCENEEKVYIFY